MKAEQNITTATSSMQQTVATLIQHRLTPVTLKEPMDQLLMQTRPRLHDFDLPVNTYTHLTSHFSFLGPLEQGLPVLGLPDDQMIHPG